MTAQRCRLGSAPVLFQAQSGRLGWHNWPNVKGPSLGSGACPCQQGQECSEGPAHTLWQGGQQGPPSSQPEEHDAHSQQGGQARAAPRHWDSQVLPQTTSPGAGFLGGLAPPPHYLLSFPREARGRDQPGSCLRCWLGWWGMWAKGPPKSRAGAKELGELWASLPPHSTPQREPPWGPLCQGAENRPPLSSARGQAQPTWLSTHPPGGRGRGGTREGAGPLLGPPGQDKFSAGLRACGTGSAPAVAAPCNLTLGSPGQPATKKLKPR